MHKKLNRAFEVFKGFFKPKNVDFLKANSTGYSTVLPATRQR